MPYQLVSDEKYKNIGGVRMGAERDRKNTAFAFDYLRVDGKKVKQGPFLTREKAEAGRKIMADAGAVCSDIYEIEIDSRETDILRAKEKGYVAGKAEAFRVYLTRELAVIDAEGIGYKIVYDYLKELEKRVLRFVKENLPWVPTGTEEDKFKGKDIKDWRQEREGYKQLIVAILKEEASHFSPLDGSVPEDIGKVLETLSEKILQMK